MTPELRAALRLVIEAYPAGSIAPMLREHALELLEGTQATAPASAQALADLTCREAGLVLGRAPSTVRSWLEAGELEGYRQRGREWRVTPAALQRFQERQRSGGGQRVRGLPRGRGKSTDLGARRRQVAS